MGGLHHINFHKDTDKITVKAYRNNKENTNSLITDDIRKIILESDSGVWIAYQYQQLKISYLSLKDNQFTHFDLDDENKDEYIFDILKQSGNYLWAISNENLYCLDISTHTVEKITVNDSIQAGMYTFCLDASGNLWIGTIGNGLIKFDPNTSRYQSLRELLPNNIYSVYSICYDNGSIWMGTDNGLYYYNIVQNDLFKFD